MHLTFAGWHLTGATTKSIERRAYALTAYPAPLTLPLRGRGPVVVKEHPCRDGLAAASCDGDENARYDESNERFAAVVDRL